MTDKQIIIDGIDVSGCKFYSTKTGYCLQNKNLICNCTDDANYNLNCYYKQLKAKEQECEKLRLEINSYVTITDECLRLDNKRLADEKRDLQQQLEQLKRKEQECERLKWYMQEIRNQELSYLDIEWDEYETHCIDTEYSNIINLVEEALEERNPEDCRYGK